MVDAALPSGFDAAGDIIVVSDLHIGRGRNPSSGRYHNLEAFFYDDDFASFCRYLCRDAKERQTPFMLVLNGDVFDLLRIDLVPAERGTPEDEHRYAAPNTPETAPVVMRQILAGHPEFVAAIAHVLERGHPVVVLAGNHDIETQWEPVRDEIRRAVREAMSSDAALERLLFRSWFLHVHERVWIEHGCQYDPANSFRYLLRGNLTDVEEAVYAAEHDMPLGNFFQRYLYNGFGHITFIVPDARANLRYVRWFLLNQPRFLFGALAKHVPFAAQVLRRIAKSSDPGRRQLEEAHQQALGRIAASSGLGERLHAIDTMKEVRGDAVQAMRALSKQLLKSMAVIGALAVAAVSLWVVGFMAISELRTGLGLRALLFVTLNFAMMAATGAVVTWSMLRGGRAWRGRPLVRAARSIAELLDVPIVVFGHTHVENVTALARADGRQSWYYNTGTWIAVFRHDELVPRDRVQYTFLRVRGVRAELLHWSPGRGEPLRVILLDGPPED
jgi:UDP-2,3-diacylglucosamine pyrophosphatase LpxH